jgi:hypothetical protein
MPRNLIIIAAVMLSLSAIIPPMIYYQQPSPAKNAKELQQLANNPTVDIDWKSILNTLPPYKQKTQHVEMTDIKTTETMISDAYIVGIVVDKPTSALIYVPNSSELAPLQLSVGDGWLADWVISEINVDSVSWFSKTRNESFTQMLFISPVSADENQLHKVKTDKTGKKVKPVKSKKSGKDIKSDN